MNNKNTRRDGEDPAPVDEMRMAPGSENELYRVSKRQSDGSYQLWAHYKDGTAAPVKK